MEASERDSVQERDKCMVGGWWRSWVWRREWLRVLKALQPPHGHGHAHEAALFWLHAGGRHVQGVVEAQLHLCVARKMLVQIPGVLVKPDTKENARNAFLNFVWASQQDGTTALGMARTFQRRSARLRKVSPALFEQSGWRRERHCNRRLTRKQARIKPELPQALFLPCPQ